jgi:6-phosphogluconolactonase
LTFSKDGKNVYLVQELDGTLTVFRHRKKKLEVIQETSLISKDFKGEISAADIHFSPDEKFLYATNRGTANTISTNSIT